jgi:hypothetical protein
MTPERRAQTLRILQWASRRFEEVYHDTAAPADRNHRAPRVRGGAGNSRPGPRQAGGAPSEGRNEYQ